MINNTNGANGKKIVIITTINYLPASPSLMNAIHLFMSADFCVDLICPKQGAWILPEYPNQKINYHYVPKIKRFNIPGLDSLIHFLFTLYICLFNRPLVIIAVTQVGLLIAGPVAILFKLPLIYFSLEVRFVTGLRSRLRKILEIFYFRFVKFTIIQDKVRAQSLLDSLEVKEMDVKKHDLILVPNSGGIYAPPAIKSNYLRLRWNIPDDKKVILYIGAFTDVSMVNELARSAKNWDPTWTLIIHGWEDKKDYLDELKLACDGKHIILSQDIVEQELLDKLVASADIGIALYKPLDRNIYDMAQSSGKIWQYLRCNLPVITMDFPSLQEMMADGRFGVCVHQPDEVEDAMKMIMNDYSRYQAHAKAFYKLYGDFSVLFKPVLERISAFQRRK